MPQPLSELERALLVAAGTDYDTHFQPGAYLETACPGGCAPGLAS